MSDADPEEGVRKDPQGDRLVCLMEAHTTIPKQRSINLSFPSPRRTATIEIRESANASGTPYDVLARFPVDFGALANGLRVTLNVEANHSFTLLLRTESGERFVRVRLNNLHLPPFQWRDGIVQTDASAEMIRFEPRTVEPGSL